MAAGPGPYINACPDCKGDGHVSLDQGRSTWTGTCTRCEGTGYLLTKAGKDIADLVAVLKVRGSVPPVEE